MSHAAPFTGCAPRCEGPVPPGRIPAHLTCKQRLFQIGREPAGPAAPMKLGQTQQQRTTQKLALTTEMRGSLDLLRMAPDEITEEVEKETRRNPFLRYVPALPARTGARDGGTVETCAQPVDPIAAILAQVALIRFSPEERRIADALPHCLDARGFLSDPADQMCAYLDAAPSVLARVAERLQRLIEPAGLFAWSLKHSLRLQLQARDRADPLILRLLDRLDLVARKDIAAICTYCGVDRTDALDMLRDLRSLDPSPLRREAFAAGPTRAPELVLRLDDDGQGVAELNAAALPAILTDDALFATFSTVETDHRALAYYKDCYRGAAHMVVALQKRANTLLRIGQQIAARQARFLGSGRRQDRKPLTMSQLATQLSLNKSTISRAMQGCDVETEHGVLPASAFFVRPLNATGTERTREQALRRLSVILRTEDPANPFSDETLAALLSQRKLILNRRTVAKYRALLGIPGRYERRRINSATT